MPTSCTAWSRQLHLQGPAGGSLAPGSPPCHCTAPDARATTSINIAPEAKASVNAALEAGGCQARRAALLLGDCLGDPSSVRTVGSSAAASPFRCDMSVKFAPTDSCSASDQDATGQS